MIFSNNLLKQYLIAANLKLQIRNEIDSLNYIHNTEFIIITMHVCMSLYINSYMCVQIVNIVAEVVDRWSKLTDFWQLLPASGNDFWQWNDFYELIQRRAERTNAWETKLTALLLTALLLTALLLTALLLTALLLTALSFYK